MITQEGWMDLKALVRQGYNFSQIGAVVGLDRRTVKKHLQALQPPVYRRPPRPSKLDAFRPLIEQWLTRAPGLRASRIYRDLRTHYGFTGSYPIVQRVVRTLRAPRPVEAHLRFETAPGHQAQVDWSYEDPEFGQCAGPVYAFHMTLGYSRDAYVEYTDRQDLTTFWACHQHAFTFFGGVPDELLYDRTKTVVKRSVGQRSELHPEALAFASHYGFTIKLCPPRRPSTKGKVEKQVDTMREWFFRGRPWTDLIDLNVQWRAWHEEAWLPHVHRTTGTTIGARLPEDRAALRPLPGQPYEVCERTTRQVGKDCRFSFEGSRYSAPAELAGQRIALRIFPDRLCLYSLEPIARPLGEHHRVRQRGSLVEDPRHYAPLHRSRGPTPPQPPAALVPSALVLRPTSLAQLDVSVVRRPLAVYALVGTSKEGDHE
jgi:transposase